MSDDVNARGTSRRHVTRAIEASLKRLQTDRVDILYLHQFDVRTPIEEQMRGLEDLVRSGKVVYPAVSNYAAWQVEKALGIQERLGWARLQALQPMYNLVKRQAEVEILPMAQANGVSIFPYSPAGGGLLSGKFANKTEKGRIADNKQYAARYGEEWMHEVAARFTDYCKGKGWHPVSAAVAWVGAHPAVTAPIVGARNATQLQASLDSVKIRLSPEVRAEMGALSRTPPPATDRLEEQRK
jgi:aryl-alcohol dehydrogenase-like predicted oxidoreductase